jgi:arylformamidase
MTAYKDRRVVSVQATKVFERDGARESLVTLGSHTGTHVDSPAHFIQNGLSIEQMSLSSLIGPCQVIDMTACDGVITASDLSHLALAAHARVLFKTKNSFLDAHASYNADFTYLAADAAAWLVNQGVVAVGIDYLGIERSQPDHQTHELLLTHNVAVIEGLRLAAVTPGDYFLICLPLLLNGLDAAPARAVLCS